ncbi:putative peptide ABC transporter solute-binding protein [Actinacidiphila reveromycinica]|uniref:Putative peptide ABC transporter solute-binding protein n=1 Tax=Actinacidiphila reveromycinica TaxID=659352 RepID=A0A7U3UW49_9ACTN|nr:ABC transporter substrate-binding protein [Streptomyces sp. SN-593]BBA99869.1 putative peptide ABC transporter solute-binding protein [Streptomyces sp. SN-593]
MRHSKARLVAAVAAVGALSLTASACSSGGGDTSPSGAGGASKAPVPNYGLGTAADSTGPAPAVAGATKGGTVQDLDQAGFDYLDPAQQYVSDQLSVSPLYARTLTGYKIDPKTGKTILVGDMATDTGKMSDGGKTWTFTLKSGLKFQDGTTITSKDVKYSIERLFASFVTQGPVYIQSWLYGTNFKDAYAGPYDGKEIPDSILATPDDKTVVFHFQTPHADAPYAMAMPVTAPVEKSKDDKAAYNNHPVSSGPYEIASYKPGKSLVFKRNPYWDPKTDPIRNAYPDSWNFQLGIQQPGLTQRIMAGSGTDKDAIDLSGVADTSQMAKLTTDAEYKARTINQYQPYVETLDINTKRITDPKVRQAIAYAFPMSQVQQAMGGSPQGDLGTTLLSPTIAGWKKYDPFGKLTQPTGNVEKAKELLKEAGQPHPKLVFPYANTPKWSTVSLTIANALEKAGFQVVRKAIDATSFYTIVGKVNNQFDIYRTGWGADWPNASTVVPPTMDGTNLTDGTNNYSFLNDPHINSEIQRIKNIADVKTQTAEWEKLSEYSLSKDTAQVPFLFDKYFNIYGSGLGGVTYNSVVGTINANTVFVKQ